MLKNNYLQITWLICLLVFSACSGSGGSGGDGNSTPPPVGPGNPPPLNVTLQSIENPLPGIYRIVYEIAGDGNSAVTAQVEYTTDGSVYQPATMVDGEALTPLASSPNGTFHTFVWNSIMDLGIASNFPGLRIRIQAQDADEVAIPVVTDPINVNNAALRTDLISSLLPNLADIQNQASNHYSTISPTTVNDDGIVLEQTFSFTSTHFQGSGVPQNVSDCNPPCPNWKKDVWNPVDVTLYTPSAGDPAQFLILQLNPDDTIVWSSTFSSLFAEFDDGSITDAGNPLADIPAALATEFAYEIASTMNMGVCLVSGLPQFNVSDQGAAFFASVDEALTGNQPRWNLVAGHAEALLRTATAVEIVRGKALAELEFIAGGSWQGGVGALIAAIADQRVLGAATFSTNFNNWQQLVLNLQKNQTLGVESFFSRAKKMIPLLNTIITFEQLGTATAATESFVSAFSPAYLIGLCSALGKPVLLQAGLADPHYPLQLRETWYEAQLQKWYPGLRAQFDQSANFGHGPGSPQAIFNWRAFAAKVFRARVNALLSIESSVANNQLTVIATVNNPDPSQLDILGCRLRYAGDENEDWRYYNLPDPSTGNCTSIPEGLTEICYDDAKAFLNRNWNFIDMLTTGDSTNDATLSYTAVLDLNTISDPHIAVFAEVEDSVASGVLVDVNQETRAYTSSQIVFVK